MENSQNNNILTVSQLTYTIKRLLENSIPEVWVEGEISNFVHHRSGHMYFSLKDHESQVRCVMFKGKNHSLTFRPANGTLVRIRGTIGVWPPQGAYQFYVNEMIPSGLGALHQAFEELKNRLQRQGLFDSKHKKTIPAFPRRIGVVTSPTGAAIRDIVNVIGRRFPLVDLVLCPARVQGDSASREIVRAIRTFQNLPDSERPDLLIVGRGGGSLEDLWPFNEEATARAVFQCDIPVISAVGHEIDFTITDFVADLRAPTPSAGAEEAVPDIREIQASLDHLKSAMTRQISHCIERRRLYLEGIAGSPVFHPRRRIQEHQLNLDRSHDLLCNGLRNQTYIAQRRLAQLKNTILEYRPDSVLKDYRSELIKTRASLETAWINQRYLLSSRLEMLTGSLKQFRLDRFRNLLNLMETSLQGYDPRAVLTRGYAICNDENGNIVSSIQQVAEGCHVGVEFEDGILECDVINRRKRNE